MTSNCNKFYLVQSGNGCYDIATANGISLSDFVAWNPDVKSDCSGLFPNWYVCVGIIGGTTTSVSSTPSSTVPSSPTVPRNGITTPTPTQTGMVTNCNKFYDVVSGDGCYSIAQSYSIPLNSFYSWNPAVGTSCASLWPNYYVCVSTVGYASSPASTTTPPTTVTPGNGITTPTPTQTGMVKNCDKFYDVQTGDGCYSIAQSYSIPLDSFYSWNPAVGTSCASLWAGYYVCVATATSIPH
jgi:LysM repeat protein